MFDSEPKYLTVKDVAEELGVSTATINNWIKLNTISTIKNNKYFERDEIKRVKSKLTDENNNQLSNRANKTNAVRTFIPVEYFSDNSNLVLVEDIIDNIVSSKLNIEKSLFVIAISQLAKSGLLNYNFSEKRFDFISDNPFLVCFLETWYDQLPNSDLSNYSLLLAKTLPDNEQDLLGICYQSLKNEGEKSKTGSYYTPAAIVENAREYVKPNTKILDPCCGTGQFLVQLNATNPSQLFGMDIDALAVKLAKVNLFIAYPKYHFEPQIFCKNFLFDLELEGMFRDTIFTDYDLIATNPPWGFRFDIYTKGLIRQRYAQIESTESFALFLYNASKLLNENGVLSFVLPESFLNVKTHSGIRKHIFKNSKILKIKYLNRIFKNVFTPVIQLDVQKNKLAYTDFIIETNNKIVNYSIAKIKQNADYSISINQNQNTDEVLDKVFKKPHYTLKNNADFALGIVTGNNEKCLSNHKTETNEAIYKGRDVQPFALSKPTHFITFEPQNFQQVAPVAKYRMKQKLIYRFISKDLVFALDSQQSLTLNSANIVIPTLDYPVKTILALFNSRLYQFIFQQKFNSIKVLKNHIESLPLPVLSEVIHLEIEKKVDDIMLMPSKKVIDELNQFILSIFDLSESDINLKP